MYKYDVIVIGAGAAGMMAAGLLSQNGATVLLLDKNERPGRKIMITGKGRCNVTNDCDPDLSLIHILLQVVFHAQIEKEQGGFTFEDICDEICKKLIIRHPHVFSNVIAETSREVLNNWDEIKKSQKGQTSQTDTLKSVPKVFPALMRSAKIQSRAAKVGFDYKDINMAFNDLQSEMQELAQAMETHDIQALFEELGDVLFSVVNVSRFLRLDAEQCLAASCDKFIRRFEKVEQLAKEEKIDMKTSSIDTLNELWNRSKKAER